MTDTIEINTEALEAFTAPELSSLILTIQLYPTKFNNASLMLQALQEQLNIRLQDIFIQ